MNWVHSWEIGQRSQVCINYNVGVERHTQHLLSTWDQLQMLVPKAHTTFYKYVGYKMLAAVFYARSIKVAVPALELFSCCPPNLLLYIYP